VRLAASWWCVLYLPWLFVPLRARLLLSLLFRVPQWMALIFSAASRCGGTSAAPCRVWHAAFVAGRFLVQTLSGASSPLRRPILRHSLHTRSHRTLHLSWASPSTHLSSLYTPRPHGYIHRGFIHRMRARIRFEQYRLSHPPICSFEGTRLIPWPSPERSKSISDEPRLLKESAFGRLLALPKELPIACCAWGGDLTRA